MLNVALFDYVARLVEGDLASDGIQWSTEVDTTTADVDVVVLTKTINPDLVGDLLVLEFGVTAALKAVSSGTADIIWKWQGRNAAGTWVDLHTAVTETNIGTTYVERTRSGYFTIQTNLNEIPFEVRLIMQCNEANEGRAKVKNSSYIRATFKVAL